VRVAVTGATGILGRNLLFELIQRHRNDLDSLEMLVLGRDEPRRGIGRRAEDAVLSDGLPYLAGISAEELAAFCRSNVRGVRFDLDREDLGLTPEGAHELERRPIDFFVHAAALTDLRTSAPVAAAVARTNVAGTQRLLDLTASLALGEFCYIGSAYACGHAEGRIPPDYVNGHDGFRNPYEASKLAAEVLTRRIARERGLRCRYFRPSIICGRLIEPPWGSICKFDVFYAVAVLLYRLKLKAFGNHDAALEAPVRVHMRAFCNPRGGLNVVPVDYAAKAIWETCLSGHPAESYHVVNDAAIAHGTLLRLICEALNVEGVEAVDVMPGNMGREEALIYRTLWPVFGPYVQAGPMLFDTESLDDALRGSGLRCPAVDERAFSVLMDYAAEQSFGLAESSGVGKAS
jgi:nucleoside-diphosphate-sugar epimerase